MGVRLLVYVVVAAQGEGEGGLNGIHTHHHPVFIRLMALLWGLRWLLVDNL